MDDNEKNPKDLNIPLILNDEIKSESNTALLAPLWPLMPIIPKLFL